MKSLLPLTNLEQHRFVQGWHANARGVLFGGTLLSWVDEDTTMLAYRVSHPSMAFTTAGMDRIGFKRPCSPGERLCFQYELAHVGKSSLTIAAKVYSAFGVFMFEALATLVSINKFGGPCSVEVLPEVNECLEGLKEKPLWKLIEKIRAERKTDNS